MPSIKGRAHTAILSDQLCRLRRGCLFDERCEHYQLRQQASRFESARPSHHEAKRLAFHKVGDRGLHQLRDRVHGRCICSDTVGQLLDELQINLLHRIFRPVKASTEVRRDGVDEGHHLKPPIHPSKRQRRPWRLGPADGTNAHERELSLRDWGWSSRRFVTAWTSRLVTAVCCFKIWFIVLFRLKKKLCCCLCHCCWVCSSVTNWWIGIVNVCSSTVTIVVEEGG